MPSSGEETPEEERKRELAKDFQHEMDLAFFIVQIGLSPSEIDVLTEKEKLFIRKEYENKFISDTTWMRNAVLNAEANVNRKKSKKFIELFPKKNARANKEYNEGAIKTIIKMEIEKGKSWVDKIFKANGMKKPSSKGKE